MKTNKLMMTIMMILTTQTAHALKVNVIDTTNFTTTQTQKMNQAVTILNQVLNSPEFKERVLNFKFVQTNGMNNQQIYDYLMSGAEKFPTQTAANQLADMHLSIYFPPWYKRFTKAVAFTNTSDPYLHIYNSYYNSASVADISETMIHEWTHKLGFDHDFNATAQRPFSVPYGIGGIINDLVSKYSQ